MSLWLINLRNFRKRYLVYYRKTGKNEFTKTDFMVHGLFDTQLQNTIHKENSTSEIKKLQRFVDKYARDNNAQIMNYRVSSLTLATFNFLSRMAGRHFTLTMEHRPRRKDRLPLMGQWEP